MIPNITAILESYDLNKDEANAQKKADKIKILKQNFFKYIKMSIKGSRKKSKEDSCSLEQIILTQADEPGQKACVYRLTLSLFSESDHDSKSAQTTANKKSETIEKFI